MAYTILICVYNKSKSRISAIHHKRIEPFYRFYYINTWF